MLAVDFAILKVPVRCCPDHGVLPHQLVSLWLG
jgi:hypothetical protein